MLRRRELLGALLGSGAGLALWTKPVLGRSRVPLVRDPFIAPVGVLRPRWNRPLVSKIAFFSYKPQEFAAAAISDDGQMVYIGSSQKQLMALRRTTGEMVWDRALPGSISSQLLHIKAGVIGKEPLLVVGDDSGLVSVLEAKSGQPRWSYHARGPVQTQPVVHGGFLYFTSNDGRIYALDVRTGSWRWSYEREATDAFSVRGSSGVLIVGERLYVGFPDGYLSCLNSETGEVIWNRQVSGEATRFIDVDGTPVLLGDMLLTSCYASGLFALDPKDGSTRWRFDIEAAGAFTVDMVNQRIYAVSAQSGLFCIDKKGRKIWQQVMTDQGELAPPTLWKDYLLISAAISGLYIADAKTGELLQCFDPGQGASARAIAHEDDVYLLSNAGSFFAFTRDR